MARPLTELSPHQVRWWVVHPSLSITARLSLNQRSASSFTRRCSYSRTRSISRPTSQLIFFLFFPSIWLCCCCCCCCGSIEIEILPFFLFTKHGIRLLAAGNIPPKATWFSCWLTGIVSMIYIMHVYSLNCAGALALFTGLGSGRMFANAVPSSLFFSLLFACSLFSLFSSHFARSAVVTRRVDSISPYPHMVIKFEEILLRSGLVEHAGKRGEKKNKQTNNNNINSPKKKSK